MSTESAEGGAAQNEEPESDRGLADSDDRPPLLKSELTDNLHDMGIDSAEDTPEPMDTEDDVKTAAHNLGADTEENTTRTTESGVSENEPSQDDDETQKDIQLHPQQSPLPSSGQDAPSPQTSAGQDDPLISSSSDNWEFIDGGGEEETPSRVVQEEAESGTGVEPPVEDTHVKDDGDNVVDSVAKDKDAEKRPMRRSRSQEDDEKDDDDDETQDDKEKMDGRGAKKYKKDKDNKDHRHLARSREPVVSRPNLSKMKTLEDFGYEFNADGQLRQIKTGSPFVFDVIPNDRSFNQKHYEALGEVITEHIYGLLETECNLRRLPVPVDATKHDPRTFIFASENVPSILRGDQSTDKKLLVLIHGSGVVRAGQWARRLIINNSLDEGTVIPYIKKAEEDDYEVMVLNTNYNTDRGRMIKGSSSPESHGKYVWEHYISKWPGHRKVAIVAHSAGGYVTVEMAKSCRGFMDKVLAVGFTDSVHSLGYYTSRDVSNWFIQHSRNWVSSSRPLDTQLDSYGRDCDRVSAGTPKHEETSYYSMLSVFRFFAEEMERQTYEDEGDYQEDSPGEQHISRGDGKDGEEEEGSSGANGKSNKSRTWLLDRRPHPERVGGAILGNRVLDNLLTTILGIIGGIFIFIAEGLLGEILDCIIHIPGIPFVGRKLQDLFNTLVGPVIGMVEILFMAFSIPLGLIVNTVLTVLQIPMTVFGFVIEFWDNTLALVVLLIRTPLSVVSYFIGIPTWLIQRVMGTNKTKTEPII